MRAPLGVPLLRELLPTGGPWQDLVVLPEVGSTNAALAADPRPWRVVTTDHQSAGRGRLDRGWVTPPYVAVAVSASLPAPVARAGAYGWLPLLTGLAMVQALHSVGAASAGLKWPNDVLLTDPDVPGGEGKVCGVLCELVDGAEGRVVVAGAGVNVEQIRGELPVPTATSLALLGLSVSHEELIAAYLERLAGWHADWASGAADRMAKLVSGYRAACLTLGREVDIVLPGGVVEHGIAHSVDATGRLVVVGGDGVGRPYAAGDVVHARLR